jgi:Uma2 family endonuclease
MIVEEEFAVSETPAHEHIVLNDVSWEAYVHLLDLLGDRRFYHTYLDGTLEFRSPTKMHDRNKSLIARLLEAAAYDLKIDIQCIGSTTLTQKAKKAGLEPDECYYVQHELEVRDKEEYDPDRDPPPDLAIEAEVSRKVIPRLPVYVRLGIPEVWRVTKKQVLFYQLQVGEYVPLERSLAFPLIEPQILQSLLAQRNTKSENDLITELLTWLRGKQR